MNPQQAFAVLTADERFQVLIYGATGLRGAFAEFCGTGHGFERITRIGVPQNLVFPDGEAAAEWLLKACLADITVAAGRVRCVRADKSGAALAA